jgi:hypothetical protein
LKSIDHIGGLVQGTGLAQKDGNAKPQKIVRKVDNYTTSSKGPKQFHGSGSNNSQNYLNIKSKDEKNNQTK